MTTVRPRNALTNNSPCRGHAGAALVAVHARGSPASTGVHWKGRSGVTTEGTIRREARLGSRSRTAGHIPATHGGRDRGTELAGLAHRVRVNDRGQRAGSRPIYVRGTGLPWRASMRAARARRSARSSDTGGKALWKGGVRSTAGANRTSRSIPASARPVVWTARDAYTGYKSGA